MGLGQTVRSPLRDKIKAKAESKLQQLDKQANKAKRYAQNAEAKGSRPGKVQRLQNKADTATKNVKNTKTVTNVKATMTGVTSSAGLGRVIKLINNNNNEEQ